MTAPILPPTILTAPAGQTVLEGAAVTFRMVPGGTAPFAFQWRWNETDLPGATTDSLYLAAARPADGGAYSVVVFNSAGQVTSPPATLTVLPKPPAPTPPVITLQPVSTNLPTGGTLRLEVAASGSLPITFQWWHDDKTLTGATQAVLLLTPVEVGDAGVYQVVVRNPVDEIRSERATVTVWEALDRPKLILGWGEGGLSITVEAPTSQRHALERSSELGQWTVWKEYDHPGGRIAVDLGPGLGDRGFFRVREVDALQPQNPMITSQPQFP